MKKVESKAGEGWLEAEEGELNIKELAIVLAASTAMFFIATLGI